MNINAFDLNLLKIFHALLTEGSTVRAAERVGLSQPAVSAALSRLRYALGDELFIRGGQGLEPSAVALAMRDEVERTISGIEQMLAFGTGFEPSQIEASVWLSGSDHFSELLLPDLLERLRLKAPGIKLILVDLVFENAFDALEKGDVDLAFWPEMPFPKWVVSQRLSTTRFELAARRGHPRLAAAGIAHGDTIPLDLMCDLSHVLFSPNGRTADDTDRILSDMGRERRIVATVPTFGGVFSILRRTDIIGTLPSHLLDTFQSLADITRHPNPVRRDDIDLAMLWHRRTDNAPLMKWLRGEIFECFGVSDRAGNAVRTHAAGLPHIEAKAKTGHRSSQPDG